MHCDLQIALAKAKYDAGDGKYREAVFAAAASARAAGDGARLARAALVLASGGGTSDAILDPELVELLEEALTAVGEEETSLRARVLSGLAVELQWGREVDRRMQLGREALALAREIGDPEVLGLVLARSWALVDGSRPYGDELESLMDEAAAVAREASDLGALASAVGNKAFLAGRRGDGVAFAANLAEAARINDGLRRPVCTWMDRNDAAALAAFTGDLEHAEQLATEAVELGRLAGRPDDSIIGSFGALLFQIRGAQGRSDELIPLLEARIVAAPDVPTWRLALAGALVESDRVDEAREHYFWLADDGCANVPRDIEYSVSMGGLALWSYAVRPPESILRDVYERFSPWAGNFSWTGPTIMHPSDHGLAMAASALQQPDVADGHFADAVALCERAGARVYLAHAHYDWAHVLADRGDAAGAREHASIALDLGTQIGMDGPHGVVPRAQSLLAAL